MLTCLSSKIDQVLKVLFEFAAGFYLLKRIFIFLLEKIRFGGNTSGFPGAFWCFSGVFLVLSWCSAEKENGSMPMTYLFAGVPNGLFPLCPYSSTPARKVVRMLGGRRRICFSLENHRRNEANHLFYFQ